MVFLDANPVIYFVEQPPIWGSKAQARVTALFVAGEQSAVEYGCTLFLTNDGQLSAFPDIPIEVLS